MSAVKLQSIILPTTQVKIDSIDSINESVAKARAILALVHENGQVVHAGFTADHETIIDALWCVESLLGSVESVSGISANGEI